MDRYFIINDWEDADQKKEIMPKIGIYDKWHPSNGNWKPDRIPVDPKDSGTDDTPIINPPEEEGSDSGAVWVVLLFLVLVAVGAVLIKVYGK